MNYVEYIIRKLKAAYPSADYLPGSATRDLLINPLSSILQDFADEQDTLMSAFSMIDPAAISEADMDAIAANFLITRSSGDKVRGYVRFYFSQPLTVNIPRNTEVSTADGLKFYTVSNHTTSKAQMFLNNDEFPLYYTNDILVEAAAPGVEYAVAPNLISQTTFTTYNPVRVRNPQEFIATAAREDNAALKMRILDEFNNGSLASSAGIKRTLQKQYPNILSVAVRGAGTEEMIRDIIYSGITKNDLLVVDFYGKISGLIDYPYVQSVGYVGSYADQDPSDDVTLPAITGLTTEWSTEMYSKIYRDDDNYVETTQVVILNEPLRTEILSDQWIKSDGTLGKNEAPNHLIEIDTTQNALKLGGNINNSTSTDAVISDAIEALRKITPTL